jgi:hypothetical protein
MRTVKYEFLSKFRPPRKLFKAATIVGTGQLAIALTLAGSE